METAPAITQATTIKAANLRPRLALEFIPERATLSFTALTVKGKLHINNAGGGPARNLRMRATMISASNTQARTIDAFYSGAIPIEVNALGDAMAGESLALEIEISIRLNELESHIRGTRQIVVPVVVADIAYDWIDGDDVARLACMIGRALTATATQNGATSAGSWPAQFFASRTAKTLHLKACIAFCQKSPLCAVHENHSSNFGRPAELQPFFT